MFVNTHWCNPYQMRMQFWKRTEWGFSVYCKISFGKLTCRTEHTSANGLLEVPIWTVNHNNNIVTICFILVNVINFLVILFTMPRKLKLNTVAYVFTDSNPYTTVTFYADKIMYFRKANNFHIYLPISSSKCLSKMCNTEAYSFTPSSHCPLTWKYKYGNSITQKLSVSVNRVGMSDNIQCINLVAAY
jgi:hypothetical protein